ncbi:MAG: histidinol-phosphate transaminase [Roseiflexaceae bacterium]|jgi:histidinol-phosphate aminotransferase|nr:histidinol-phosphate transaminase [Chloroflexaceae bacterium]MCE2851235.1 histidinol-phosphate transaminase [Chloroflexaceae bacterium]
MRKKPAIAALHSMRGGRAAPPVPVQARLSANENPLGVSPQALSAVRDALTSMHRYADPSTMQLRVAIAQHLNVTPDMVLCANGSDELILLTALAYMNPGDEIIMANGTFISYYNRTQMMGAVQKRIPLVNGVHDLNAMAAAITPATTMILICNPNNPTGTTNSATEMQQFLARVPDDVLVVVDEAYVEYVTRADFPDMIGEIRAGRKNMLVLRTFAKIYGLAGLRLGYAIGDPDMLDYINRTRPVFDVNCLAMVAGIAALGDSAHVAASRAQVAEARAFFMRELSAMGLQPFASETNFVAVPVGGEGSDAQVAQALAARGVAINPLGGWGLPGVIRISFGTPTENTLCINALREVMASR